jgi:hypothetical protein
VLRFLRCDTRLIAALAVVNVLLSDSASVAYASPSLWGTDGSVTAIAKIGKVIYLGGSFTLVGPSTGSLVAIDRATGAVDPGRLPRVAGAVKTMIPDGAGGWFIGGSFVGVGGLPRAGLAHVLASGQVSDWDPQQDGFVDALALAGGTVYVGGAFNHIGGAERRCLAALDARTAIATAWRSDTDAEVRTLLALDSTLVVGGDFTEIEGQPRMALAQVDLGTGVPTDWDPDVETAGYPGSVRCTAKINSTLYVGGSFWYVHSIRHRNLAAIDLRTAQASDWTPDIMNCNCSYDIPASVEALLQSETGTIFAAGHFDQVNSFDRAGIAEIDLATGTPTQWDAHLGPRYQYWAPTVMSMAMGDGTIYVGSAMHTAGGDERYCLAELDRATGRATGWNPRANSPVEVILVSGDEVYAGGSLTMVGWQKRKDLAALDVDTGRPTAWDPEPDGLGVWDIAVSPERVYIGGDFNSIGGEQRSNLAAIDPVTGLVMPWEPNPNGLVEKLAIGNGCLYVGGSFNSISAIGRNYAAAFDLRTEALTGWNPNPNNEIYAIAPESRAIYLGGLFSTIGDVPRNFLAAVDALDGDPLSWNPAPNAQVHAIASDGGTVFIGGIFRRVGVSARAGLAAVDATSGDVRDWVADIGWSQSYSGRVLGLSARDGTIFACGVFDSIGGVARGGVAALDQRSGRVLDWNPNLGGASLQPGYDPAVVWSMAQDGKTFYAGGLFNWSGNTPEAGFAGLDLPKRNLIWPPRGGVGKGHLLITPNPVSAATTVQFALGSNATVTVAVFDIRGRMVRELCNNQTQAAGLHEMALPIAGLPVGCYFCRLVTPQLVAMEKFVILK